MKFCPNCGEKLDTDSNFCNNCGNQVSDIIINKSNINKVSNKSISDILNPILERPKLLLVIIIVLIFIIGITSIFNFNSDSNAFGGQEVTVNGVNFRIPEGFVYYSIPGSYAKTDSDFVLRSSDGTQALAYIHIRVSDSVNPSSALAQTLSDNNKVTINGKECHIRTSSDGVSCAYYSGDKGVQLNVPYSYEYNNKVISYEETLKQMIE